MKAFLSLILLFCTGGAISQVSVFSCQSSTQVTQAIINAAGTQYYQQCIEFPDTQTFSFGTTSNKEIKAVQEIKIEPGFTAGGYTTGQMKLTTNAKSPFDVAVMNYSDLNAVSKLEKLELGVILPTDIATKVQNFVLNTPSTPKINPFLEWELDVEATFTEAATSATKKVDGFYYREYQRDLTNSEWDEVATPYQMRIRFSPPTTGKWLCTISIKVNNVLVFQSSEFLFTVVNSSNPGYVKIHQNQRNLELNGRMIFPVGVNFDGPIKNTINTHSGPSGDVYGPEDIDFTTTPQNWITYHNDIAAYHDQGGRYIRTLQNPWGALIEFQEKGNYYNRMHYAWEQDRLLDYCEANDMLIHFNLMHQEPFMKYGNYHLYDWDWSHYNDDGSYFAADIFPAYCYANGDQKEPYEMFLLEDDLKYHEQRIRYYIARYGYATSIYLIELLSESWHLNEISGQDPPFTSDSQLGVNVRTALSNFHQRMSSYIKQTLGHTQHLVGIDIYTSAIYNTTPYIDASVSHPDIDVISFNPYSAIPGKLINTKSDNVDYNNVVENDENSMYRVVKILQGMASKPVMIAEGGAGDSYDDCSDFAQQYVDMMTFGFTGIAGYNSWIGGFTGHEVTWPVTIRAQLHMNGNDVINTLSGNAGDWMQGRQKTYYLNQRDERDDSKEHQYYISKNQELAVGYVKNRTFNAYTMRNNDAGTKCIELGGALAPILQDFNNFQWNNQKLTIDGLKYNTDYRIHWYSFKQGNYMNSYCFNTSFNGRADIVHPQLYVHPDAIAQGHPLSAVLWYVIEQYDCDRSQPISTEAILIDAPARPEKLVGNIEQLQSGIQVFPNPANNEVTILSNKPIESFILANNLNQVILKGKTDSTSHVLDISMLTKGIYLLTLENGAVFKLIKL